MDRKRITILGSTGSIGDSTVDLIDRDPHAYDVVALTANGNWEKLAEQAKRLKPAIVAVADPAKLGTGYDLDGAARALTRWKPAHAQGGITSLSDALGTVCAIPDTINAIPDNAIPC